jgi:hypothetical protein
MLSQQVERHALVNQRPHIPRIGCQYLVQLGDRSFRLSGHEIDQRQRPNQVRLAWRRAQPFRQ